MSLSTLTRCLQGRGLLNYIKCGNRSRFMNLWTFPTEDDREVNLSITLNGKYVFLIFLSVCMQIVVRVVSAPEKLSLSSNKSDQSRLEAALLSRLRGFSRIVDTLVAERIPIVGHNCLMDFMLIYQGNTSNSQCISGLNYGPDE